MLKKLFALSLVVSLLGLTTGCPSKDKKTKTEAKTGTKVTDKTSEGKITERTEEKVAKLELSAPKDVSITQGGEESLTINVTRTNTKEDINVKFSDLPKGVSVKEADTKIIGGQDEGKFTFQAAADAEVVKDKVAKVTITDATGKLTQNNTFKVTVKKKDK